MIPAALLILALTPAGAESPLTTGPTLHPGNFYVPVLQGEAELHPESSAAEGVTTLRHDKLFQTLGWEPAEGSLTDAALHKRGLVYQALQRAVPADAPKPAVTEVAGTAGLSWEVDGGPTLFVGTSWHCPDLRVELTTFGPDAALVRAQHKASLAGADCHPSGGLGMSSE